jgi:hypothetical protein
VQLVVISIHLLSMLGNAPSAVGISATITIASKARTAGTGYSVAFHVVPHQRMTLQKNRTGCSTINESINTVSDVALVLKMFCGC